MAKRVILHWLSFVLCCFYAFHCLSVQLSYSWEHASEGPVSGAGIGSVDTAAKILRKLRF